MGMQKSVERRKNKNTQLIHLPGQKQVKLTHTHKQKIKAKDNMLNQNDRCQNLWTIPDWQKVWL
jgi:hypothetical protein